MPVRILNAVLAASVRMLNASLIALALAYKLLNNNLMFSRVTEGSSGRPADLPVKTCQ